MPQVDFYLLSGSDLDSGHLFACRLIETIWKKNHKVYVHLPDQASAEAFNITLWQFKPEAFVPHDLVGQQPPSPIELGWPDHSLHNHHPVLVNLNLTPPAHWLGFERIAEIIHQDPQHLAAKRTIWQDYKAQGCTLLIHDLR